MFWFDCRVVSRNIPRDLKWRTETVANAGLQEVYSCFEKGCPTKPYATMPKGIMGNGGLWYLIEALGVSAT